ncbi:MAG: hypothetical protein GY926_12920 [bacterium]|nr:hypothetical protein [bacterium]
MSITLVFADLTRCDGPTEYVDRKLAASFPDLPEEQRIAIGDAILSIDQPTRLDVVLPAVHPVLDEEQQARVDRHVSLFSRAVDRFSPLLPDEVLREPDSFSYLANPFREHEAGTPVFSRSTNRADLQYLFEGARFDVERREVGYAPPAPGSAPRVLAFAGLGGPGLHEAPEVDMYIPDFLDPAVKRPGVSDQEILVGKMVKGLVGLIPEVGGVGADIIGFFLPSGEEIDFKQLLDDVREISHDENVKQTISREAGELHGATRILSTYLNVRAKGASKQDLVDSWLLPQYRDVVKSLGVLSESYYAELALPTYLAGTNVKYLILQELAIQDSSVANPQDSAYCFTICQEVPDDVEHVTTTTRQLETRFDAELATRRSKVTDLHIRITDCPKNEWYFRDLGAGYQSPYFEQRGCRDDPVARGGRSRSDYLARVEQEYRTAHHDQLPWMRLVADHWRKLQDNPLPAS